MPAEKRTRRDPRRETTRIALIEAAESLFAEGGVEGVSTRQIGAAIGSSNTNVVAYHFGSKEALIDAVYLHRLPAIDARRGELLDEADAKGGATDVAALVRIFFQPLYEQTDSAGRHSYARFLSAIERSGMIGTRARVSGDFPETDRARSRLFAALPKEIAPLLNVRLRLIAGLMSNTLLLIDREAADDSALAKSLFDNAVAMAAAAMRAPFPAGGGGAKRDTIKLGDKDTDR